MSTLYRKHRPMSFADAVGQNHVKVTLQNEIQTGKIAHAYLFCGPRGVGKTTFARLLAKALNCEKRKAGESEPCNKCLSCVDINDGRSFDIVEIDAASHTGVDNVRENIIASARTGATKDKYKVFIIDEVHMLSISAFNALLKTIEEPPALVIFILCTTETHKVPATIISRCQRFDFKRISVTDLVKKLNFIVKKEDIKIDKSIIESIARHSEGYMRDAESTLGQILSIGGKEITQAEADLVIPRSDIGEIINLIDLLVKKDPAKAIELVNKLVDDGVDLKSFTGDLIEILRKIMLEKINMGLADRLGLELGENLEMRIREAAKDLNINQAVVFIEKFIEVKNKVKDSFIAQLPFEVAIVELTSSSTSVENINSVRVVNNPGVRVAVNMPVSGQVINEQQIVVDSKQKTGNSKQIAGNLSVQNVKDKWHEVLTLVKDKNHSLSFILRACQPRDVRGNQICLVFKYRFHKDRVSDMQIKAIVEEVLREVYGLPLAIEAMVDENLEIEESPRFGGEQAGNPSTHPAEAGFAQDRQEEGMGNKETLRRDSGQEGSNGMVDNILKTFGGRVVK